MLPRFEVFISWFGTDRWWREKALCLSLAFLEEASGEEVSIESAVDDCHEVPCLHGEEGFLEVLASEVSEVCFVPSGVDDTNEFLVLYGARACREEGAEGSACLVAHASVSSHALGYIDHNEVGQVVRGLEAFSELDKRCTFSDHGAQQVALCVVVAGVKDWGELQHAFA